MENYIMIGGKKINLSNETVEEFKKRFKTKEELTYEDMCSELGMNKHLYYTNIHGEIDLAINLGSRYKIDLNNASSKEQLECMLQRNKLINIANYFKKTEGANEPNNWWYFYYLGNTGLIIRDCIFTSNIGEYDVIMFPSEESRERAMKIMGDGDIRLGEENIKKALKCNF